VAVVVVVALVVMVVIAQMHVEAHSDLAQLDHVHRWHVPTTLILRILCATVELKLSTGP